MRRHNRGWPILAEPPYRYSVHRKPQIVEVSDGKGRAPVHFVAHGLKGSFRNTCLYALRNGGWGYYTIKPNASETIATADTWLGKREWED